MTTVHVRQQHDYGCGLAALAMIDDKSYDDVCEWLLANWPDGNERPEEWLTERGIHGVIAEWYLSQHGYVWRTLYAAWDLSWPPAPFAPVHLAQVRQPSGNSHFVVMRADGVVLDPLSDEPRTLTDWPKVDNVRGIWPIARYQAAAAAGMATVDEAERIAAERNRLAAVVARVEALCERVENRMMATAKPSEIRAALGGAE